MGLAALTDVLTSYLESAISPAPALVGATYPTVTGDLPALVVSFSDVQSRLQGIGRLPAPSETGALQVTTIVDLADPVATFPDATVLLLSNDRLTLSLPHGPLVAADGTATTFAGGDLHVTVGATTFTVVDAAPGAGEVQPDPISACSTSGRRYLRPGRSPPSTSSASGRCAPSGTRAPSSSRPSPPMQTASTR